MVVRDDQELPLRAQARQHLAKPPDVGVIEGRVDLVEDRERAWVDLVQSEHESKGRQGPLAARQQRDVLQSLAWRLDQDFDSRARPVIALRVLERRAASRRELREIFVEV